VARTGDGMTELDTPAPLDTLPLWRAANAWVPMYARAADTLIAATSPGVASYDDPAYGGELRLLITPSGPPALLQMEDGTAVSGSQEGLSYAIDLTAPAWRFVTIDFDLRSSPAVLTQPATVDAGGTTLPAVGDEPSLQACGAPGCWLLEAGRLRIRLPAPATGLLIRVT
jgi:hypothetical protein